MFLQFSGFPVPVRERFLLEVYLSQEGSVEHSSDTTVIEPHLACQRHGGR